MFLDLHVSQEGKKGKKQIQTSRKIRGYCVNHKTACTSTSAELPSSAAKWLISKSKSDGKFKD